MGLDPTPPAAGDVEISLFGPGFGEAVAVHFGGGRWLLVDSCEEQPDGPPSSLAYLDQIGVDPKKQVDYVLVSHWHDDHIRGLGEIVQRCSKARVAISAALSASEFLTLMRVAEKRAILDHSGVSEMDSVCSFLDHNRRRPKRATANTRLYRDSAAGISWEVWSLSPSTEEMALGETRFARLLTEQLKGNVEWVDPTDLNQLSVVLWIEVGAVRVLLGSDLTNTRRGWHAICESRERPEGASQVFKVPHHASHNAQCEPVWVDMLDPKPYALVTPFNRGRPVPNAEEAGWVSDRTPHAWITAEHGALTGLQPAVARVIEEACDWATMPPRTGHIRLRRPAVSSGAWSLDASDTVRAL